MSSIAFYGCAQKEAKSDKVEKNGIESPEKEQVEKVKKGKVSPPESVKVSFAKLFPTAEEVKWEKEEDGNYEAEYELNENEQSSTFDPTGKLLETEVEIKISELPVNVMTYVHSNFPAAKVKEASKITDAKGTITYEAEVKRTDLIFDVNGNFLKIIK